MRFRRSAGLAAGQFISVFKLLLYTIITGAIFFSLTYLILHYGLARILSSTEFVEIKRLVRSFLKGLLTADSATLSGMPAQLRAAISDFLRLLGENKGTLAGSAVGVAVMYLLARYFNGLAHFAIGETVNDRMALNARTSFATSYFRNFAKASVYQLFYVPVSFVFDALSVSLCVLLFFYIPSLLAISGILSILLSLSLSLALILCLQALKLTFASSWMPAVIAGGKSVGGALKQTRRGMKCFGRKYAAYLVSVYLIFIGNLVCAIATLGSALLLTVPFSYIFLLCMQFVNYYLDEGKKFYVTEKEIAGEDPAKPE